MDSYEIEGLQSEQRWAELMENWWYMPLEHSLEIVWVAAFIFLYKAAVNEKTHYKKVLSRQMVLYYFISETFQIFTGFFGDIWPALWEGTIWKSDPYMGICFLIYDVPVFCFAGMAWYALDANVTEQPFGHRVIDHFGWNPKLSPFVLPAVNAVISLIFCLFTHSGFQMMYFRLLEAVAFIPQFLHFKQIETCSKELMIFIHLIFIRQIIRSLYEWGVDGFSAWMVAYTVDGLMCADFIFFYWKYGLTKEFFDS